MPSIKLCAMLLTVTSSNLLDVKAMEAFASSLSNTCVGHAVSLRLAVEELAEIWNDAADRGEFLFRDSRSLSGERHARPRIVPSYGVTRVVPTIDPLVAIVPSGIDPVAWREAIDQTRAMLLTVTDSRLLDVKSMRELRDELSQHVSRARDHPEMALIELTEIWNQVARGFESRQARPKILPPPPERSSRAKISTAGH